MRRRRELEHWGTAIHTLVVGAERRAATRHGNSTNAAHDNFERSRSYSTFQLPPTTSTMSSDSLLYSRCRVREVEEVVRAEHLILIEIRTCAGCLDCAAGPRRSMAKHLKRGMYIMQLQVDVDRHQCNSISATVLRGGFVTEEGVLCKFCASSYGDFRIHFAERHIKTWWRGRVVLLRYKA